MKNITKFETTPQQIGSIFQAAGLGEVSCINELSDGWFNRIFSAVAKDGKKYVLKLAPSKDAKVLSYEKDMMESEVNCYRLLAEKTNIKMPKIVFSDFSQKVVPTSYFIMEYLNGERLDKAKLTPQERQKSKEQMAWILSEFHKIKGESYGYEQMGLRDNFKDALATMTKKLIEDAASFGKKCRVGEKLLHYIDKFSSILEKVPCVLVNFDLHSMNIFCSSTQDGEIELALFDLERGFWGDPIGDFVTPEPLKRLTKKAVFIGYNRFVEKKILAGREEEIRFALMTGYLAVITYVERFSRFRGAGKYTNSVFLIGTIASKLFKRQAFSALKKFSNEKG